MAQILIGSREGSTAPVAQKVAPSGMRHTWTGWDGSEWVLCGDDTSPVYLRSGLRGTNPPDNVDYTLDQIDGQVLLGMRTPPRDVFWPLGVKTTPGDFTGVDSAFWRTLHPGKPGVWTVTQLATGQSRSLRCRYQSSDHELAIDPTVFGEERYGVKLVADDPWWRGRPVVGRWSPETPQDFFQSGTAPPFYITNAHTFDTATLTNPGDVPAWPVWELAGPFTTAHIGVNGELFEIPFPLASGETLIVDADPRGPYAVTGAGVDRTNAIPDLAFAPVPPGEDIVLDLALAGAGSISVEFTPGYRRAW